MLRKATQDDLPALVALRCKAARTNRTDAAGWLQNVAGLENILLLEKGVCDLYVHGVIESSTSNVHQTFSHALSDSLAMQDTLYDKMAAKGWYPTDRAEMTKVQAVKKKCQSMQG